MVSFSKFSSKNETEELWILRSKRPDSLLDLVQWPFDRLMIDLVSNSNTDRARAEEFLQYLSENHPALLCLKTSLLLCSPHSEKRFVSAILLQQFFTPASDFYVWPRLSPICQFYLKIILLLALEEEKIRHIANAIIDTVAKLASNLVPLPAQYLELLRFVLARMGKNEPPVLVEASLHIFAQIVKPLADVLVLKVPTLRSTLSMCINHPTSSDVRVAALPALCCLVQSLPSSVDRNELGDLLILLNNGLAKALTEIEITVLPKVLEMLINLAGAEPNFFCNFIRSTNIVLHILAVAENSQVEEGARHLALEFMMTLAEAREPATAAMCKMPLIGNRVLAILLEMLLDVHNDMSWGSAQLESKDTNQSGNYALALECLDRLVFALGGISVLKSAEDALQTYVISSDCKKRHAALVALAQITQGCSTKIDLGDVFHDKVLTALGTAMDDFENPCMQVSSVMALQKFLEKCADKILIVYRDEIVRKLVLLIKQGKHMVQEGAVSALTTITEAHRARDANLFDDEQLSKFYDAVMPHLMRILINATNKTYSSTKRHRILLAKSADCISLIGESAGRGKFIKHDKVVMGVLISLHKTLNPEDPATNYILRATATMCQSLGHHFLPYMNIIMKYLLECALLKPAYGIASDKSIADVQYMNDMRNEAAVLKMKRIRLRMSFFEEKAAACNSLYIYVSALQEHFFPWAEKVALVLAPHMDCNYHVEVKKASARALPQLLQSAKLAIEKGTSQDHDAVKKMFALILPNFLDGIHKTRDFETYVAILHSLYQCLQLSAGLLEEYEVQKIVDVTKHLLTSSAVRMRERKKMKTESHHGEEELINKNEGCIVAHIGKCLTILAQTQQTTFLSCFDELHKHISPMMESKAQVQNRRSSLLTIVDIFKHCGGAALRYHGTYLHYFLLACNDHDHLIREFGLHGVAICAIYGGSGFQPFVNEALEKVYNVIQSRDALEKSYLLAVFTLSCICKFHKFRTRVEAIATWLNCLPIRCPRHRATIDVHEHLYSMVESSDRQLLGENNENLTKIISIFTEILSSHELLAKEETRNQMVNFLKALEVENSSIYSSPMISGDIRLQLQAILKWA